MAEEPFIIQVPNQLKSKVSYGPGGVDLDAIERAEAVIANLQGNYLEWVQEDLNKIQKFYDQAKAEPDNRPAMMKEIFRISHDIKGQGGSFEYHMMTAIGNHLCRYIEKIGTPSDERLNVIKLHIDAMRLVIAQRMEGDGGKVGDNLLRGLAAVVAKVPAED